MMMHARPPDVPEAGCRRMLPLPGRKEMMGKLILVALLLGSGAVVGCGSAAVGPDGTSVGGPCAGDDDCASGSRCETGGDFPGGMCLRTCAADDDCPDGSACISEKGGICLPKCTSGTDCRSGYECADEGRKEAEGKVSVCSKD